MGLYNQANTCYLNSLIQAMYMMPEFRAGLYAVDPALLNVDLMPEPVIAAAGASESKAGGASESTASAGEARGAADAAEGSEAAGGGGGGGGRSARRPRTVPLQLQRLFAQLQLLDVSAVSTIPLTEVGFKWTAADAAVQHDINELNKKLFEAIEGQLKGKGGGESLISRLYKFSATVRLECCACGARRTGRDEVALELGMEVKGLPDLLTSLAALVTPERLGSGNEVECEACSARAEPFKVTRTAHLKGTVIPSLPPVLQFSLNRYDFDLRTLSRVKVTSRFDFPLAMDIGAFVVDGGVAAAGAAVASVPDGGDAGVLGEMRAALEAQLAQAKSRAVWITDLETTAGRARAAAVSSELGRGPHVYDLAAVVIHGGSAGSGHYHAYIRDVLHEGTWVAPPEAPRPPPASTGGAFGGGGGGRSSSAAAVEALAAPDEAPLDLLRAILAEQPLHPIRRLPFTTLDSLGAVRCARAPERA